MPARSILFFLFIQLITACQQNKNDKFSSKPEVEIDLDEIKKRGVLNVLIDNNSFSYFIYKGEPKGYEYELLQLLAKHLKVRLNIKVISGVENSIDQLNHGEGDILAFPMTVTKERRKFVSFTRAHFHTYQVLVQRKPDNWRTITQDEINKQLIRNPTELIGKEVHVMKASSFVNRLKSLSDEIGGDIIIKEDSVEFESESLVQRVVKGEIQYTVADHMIAMVNASYYPDLDVATPLSLPQQIAWATRKNSPELLKAVNAWLDEIKKEPTFMVIYNRYFKSPRSSRNRFKSDYSSLGGKKISKYDDIIKEEASRLGWDWRLLAAVIYEESRFQPKDESWAGARGLMQLMPATAREFGAENPDNPKQNIRAGVNYMKYLDRYWSKTVLDSLERLPFVLASYNVGLSHIIDARKLAEKYGDDPTVWKNHVEAYLLKKSEPKYFRDPLAVAGYCKCEEPVNYVRDVLSTFEEYKLHIN
ncbi:MAG: transporter substrate-binding domain-containing protein [Flammeovirgaceae bacterium]|nr:transporter substrate-binding domain-containing protein [Flammeovirgaceae bacterium]